VILFLTILKELLAQLPPCGILSMLADGSAR